MPDLTPTRPASGAPVESGWGQAVHDALEGLQAGSSSVVFSASPTSNTVAVTFPRAYASPPTVLVCASSQHYSITPAQGVAITNSGFSASGRYIPGTNASATIPFYWVAIGTPA